MRTSDGITTDTVMYRRSPALRRWRWNAFALSKTDGRVMYVVGGRAFTRRGAERARARGLRRIRALSDPAFYRSRVGRAEAS